MLFSVKVNHLLSELNKKQFWFWCYCYYFRMNFARIVRFDFDALFVLITFRNIIFAPNQLIIQFWIKFNALRLENTRNIGQKIKQKSLRTTEKQTALKAIYVCFWFLIICHKYKKSIDKKYAHTPNVCSHF